MGILAPSTRTKLDPKLGVVPARHAVSEEFPRTPRLPRVVLRSACPPASKVIEPAWTARRADGRVAGVDVGAPDRVLGTVSRAREKAPFLPRPTCKCPPSRPAGATWLYACGQRRGRCRRGRSCSDGWSRRCDRRGRGWRGRRDGTGRRGRSASRSQRLPTHKGRAPRLESCPVPPADSTRYGVSILHRRLEPKNHAGLAVGSLLREAIGQSVPSPRPGSCSPPACVARPIRASISRSPSTSMSARSAPAPVGSCSACGSRCHRPRCGCPSRRACP